MAAEINRALVERTDAGDGVVIIRLARAHKLNALSTEMLVSVTAALEEAIADDACRAIVLTGSGSSFVAGADIKEMIGLEPPQSVEFISRISALNDTIRRSPKPVVAAVNGYCFGAGLELAISCDVVLAAESASFGMQEVELGIPSVVEAALLPFVIGLTATREMLLTGDVYSSQQALDMRLINHRVADDQLMDLAVEKAARIGSHPATAVAAQKRLINTWLEHAGVDSGVAAGVDAFGLSFLHANAKDRMKAHFGMD